MKLNLENFKQWLGLKGLKERTIDEYLSYANKLAIYSTFNQEVATNFLFANNNMVAKAFLKNVKEYYIMNRTELGIDQNAAMEIQMITFPKITGKKKKVVQDVIDEQELLRIESVMSSERNKIMLLLSFYSGVRMGGLLNIRPYDFNWKIWTAQPGRPGELKIKGKGDKWYVTIVPPSLMLRIRDWIRSYASLRAKGDPTKPLFEIKQSRWAEILSQASIRALNKHIHPHTLRHSSATYMMQHDMRIEEIKEVLGHSDIGSTQIYAHMNQEKLKDKYLATFGES